MKKNKKPVKRIDFAINLYTEEVYNNYGVDDRPLLSDELSYTIEEKANTKKIKTNFNIALKKSDDININETDFMDAYLNTFTGKVKKKRHEFFRCLYTGLIMLAVGIGLLAFDVFIEGLVPYFWYEFFNVFAWVFCWGGIEVLTVELVQIEMEIRKIKRLTNAKLKFVKAPKKQSHFEKQN